MEKKTDTSSNFKYICRECCLFVTSSEDINYNIYYTMFPYGKNPAENFISMFYTDIYKKQREKL